MSRLRRCLPVLIVRIMRIAARAGATEFYVDPVNGSNGSNGSTASPWRTLQAVIDADLVESRNWSSLPYQAPPR